MKVESTFIDFALAYKHDPGFATPVNRRAGVRRMSPRKRAGAPDKVAPNNCAAAPVSGADTSACGGTPQSVSSFSLCLAYDPTDSSSSILLLR
jgi:hypothetical protein